jgi:lantibiotic biosynthesis protein
MKKNQIYKSADFFMIRYANLPFKNTTLANDIEKIEDFYNKNLLFQEAIAIGSFDLHQSLKKGINKKASISLMKYLIRMSTRATPFGLFSSLGWGSFNDKSTILFDPSFLKKKIRLSMECLEKLIEEIHKDKNLIKNIKVMLNPLIIKKNKRVFIYKSDTLSLENYISIKHTSAFDFLLQKAAKPILYSKLEKELIKHFSHLDKDNASNYLWEIFTKKYLISELETPFKFANTPSSFFENPNLYNKNKNFLLFKDLLKILNEYENSDNRKGLKLLQQIRERINTQNIKIKEPLQIDSYYDKKDLYLHKNIKAAFEKAAFVYTKLSLNKSIPENFRKIHNYILEKYGTSRLIPFSDIISDHYIQDLIYSRNIDDIKQPNIIDSYLSLFFNSKEIDLESAFKMLPDNTEEEIQKMPSSFEIYFDILAHSLQDIDKGNFQLMIKGLSPSLGATFGRFLYLWDEDKINKVVALAREEQSLYPENELCESLFLPENPKVANVSNGLPIRKEQLPLHYHDLKDFTSLDDIYIGTTLENIYLYSKKLKKELLFTPNVMTNPIFLPPPLKLLLAFSQNQFFSFNDFTLNMFKFNTYTPRIKYQNIILSPAKWNFNYDLLSINSNTSSDKVKKSLKEALKKYKVPSKIILSQHDNKLLLDVNIEDHFEIILKYFIKTKTLSLTEQILFENNLFANNEQEKYICELVVPFTKNDLFPMKRKSKEYPPTTQINYLQRTSFPGDDWFYANIFLPSEDMNIFITSYLYPYIEFLKKNYSIEKWFFIRYIDKTHQLRVRINSNPKTIQQKIFQDFNHWTKTLIEHEIIETFNLSPYEAEIERYGGVECKSFIEDFFYVDSELCYKILSIKKLPFPIEMISCFGIINILKELCSNIDAMLEIIHIDKSELNLLSGIRQYSKLAFKYISNLFFNINEELDDDFLTEIKDIFSHTSKSLKNIKFQIDSQKHVPWNTKENIISSLIHMHCNRTLGVNRLEERKALVIAHHFLEKIKKRQLSPSKGR